MNPELPLKSYERDKKTRTAVEQLRTLLNVIYPDPTPDIFTLDDFINRYPLTGLGDLATREIEQAVRINQSLNNYDQMGLCEFHVGLIFLYWGDFRGSSGQFESARKKWGFAGKTATSSLCYFATGLANFLALHYENALLCYALAERALKRVGVKRNKAYYQKISTYIQDAQFIAREATWARVRAKPSDEMSANNASTDAEDHEQAEQEMQPEPTPEPYSRIPLYDLPQADMPASPSEEESPSDDLSESILPPQTHLPISTEVPFPGHQQSDVNYGWYQVENGSGNHLYGDVADGDWLLVRKELVGDEKMQIEDSVLVLMNNDKEIDNAVHIHPDKLRPFQRIYLATCTYVGDFTNDLETGEVTLLSTEPMIKVIFSSSDQQISVQWSSILGIVVGFWHELPNNIAPTHLNKQA